MAKHKKSTPRQSQPSGKKTTVVSEKVGNPVEIAYWRKFYYLTGLLAVLWVLFVWFTIYFFTTGYSGYQVTILVYAIIGLSIFLFVRRKVLRYNLLAVAAILFIAETYLKLSGKGYLNYMEANSPSLMTPYLSNNFERNRLINGLYTGRPNNKHVLKTIEYSYQNNHNELGLREKPLRSFASTNNILLLGDSYTEGVGAPADSTIEASLEYFLNQQQLNYKVINGGVSGSDIVFAYQLLRYLQPVLRPKVVILNLNYSDISDIAIRGGDERFVGNNKLNYRKGMIWEYPYSFSFIFRVIVRSFFHLNPYDLTDEDYQYAKKIILDKTDDYIRYCNSKGIQFVLVFSPGPSELYNNYFSYNGAKEAFEQKNGYYIIYMDGFIREELSVNKIPLDSFYYRIDLHMRPKGNWFWGKTVAQVLAEKKLL